MNINKEIFEYISSDIFIRPLHQDIFKQLHELYEYIDNNNYIHIYDLNGNSFRFFSLSIEDNNGNEYIRYMNKNDISKEAFEHFKNNYKKLMHIYSRNYKIQKFLDI